MMDLWDEDLNRGRPMETGCWSVYAQKPNLIDSGHGSDQTIDRSNDLSSASSGTSSVDTTNLHLQATGRGRSIRGRQQIQSDVPIINHPPPQFPARPAVPKPAQPHPPPPSMKDTTPYIPPEPTDDETEMFRQGISSGIHFKEYDKIPINVSGDNCPPPIQSFAEASLSPFLMQNVYKSGYNRPTPVQKTAIPVILAHRDLMACAQTGSGKTAAFLLPIVESLLAKQPPLVVGQPQVVIITPTRELTIQIFKEARKFAMGSFLKLCIVYGGTLSTHQRTNVAKGCHILLATPGRLSDFVSKGYVSFASLQYLVLDEADRMMNLGFLPIIEKLLWHSSMVPQAIRQTVMLSATFPPEIQRLAGRFLRSNYIFLAVGVVGGACADVQQTILEVGKYDKRKNLLELLNAGDPSGTMVFVETRRQADFLASFLSESQHPTTSIHGERLQRQREEALADFTSNAMKVLIATSVAARGLDIRNVTHVINFDLPKDVDEYVHRIGRTGRVGNRGKATSFYDPEADSPLAADLVKILQQANQEVPHFLAQAIKPNTAVTHQQPFHNGNAF